MTTEAWSTDEQMFKAGPSLLAPFHDPPGLRWPRSRQIFCGRPRRSLNQRRRCQRKACCNYRRSQAMQCREDWLYCHRLQDYQLIITFTLRGFQKSQLTAFLFIPHDSDRISECKFSLKWFEYTYLSEFNSGIFIPGSRLAVRLTQFDCHSIAGKI